MASEVLQSNTGSLGSNDPRVWSIIAYICISFQLPFNCRCLYLPLKYPPLSLPLESVVSVHVAVMKVRWRQPHALQLVPY